MDLKQEAARKAAGMVTEGAIVGLGAGSTIAYLVKFLKQRVENGMAFQFVTSSFSTLQLLELNQLPVRSAASLCRIDLYFDGCDQLDRQLNALKSGGGIHTQEKLLASMAGKFVLIGDISKMVEKFDVRYPLVLEILPQAAAYIPARIAEHFPGSNPVMRINNKIDGPVITINGNYLLDVFFNDWPGLTDLNTNLKNIAGIVETSLFYRQAEAAILAGDEGVVVFETTRREHQDRNL
jgi:ribose 5-phosphate isomerase A